LVKAAKDDLFFAQILIHAHLLADPVICGDARSLYGDLLEWREQI